MKRKENCEHEKYSFGIKRDNVTSLIGIFNTDIDEVVSNGVHLRIDEFIVGGIEYHRRREHA